MRNRKQGWTVADDNRPDLRDRDLHAIGIASSLGFSLVATLVVLIGGGVLLDQWLDTSPLFTLIGVALGLIAAAYQLYELTLLGRKDRENGPLTRALERRKAAKQDRQ
jgi:F0F1-type ATP synthase assembly protein I